MTTDEILRLLRLAEDRQRTIDDDSVAPGSKDAVAAWDAYYDAIVEPGPVIALCRANLRLVAMEEAVQLLGETTEIFVAERTAEILASMEKGNG